MCSRRVFALSLSATRKLSKRSAWEVDEMRWLPSMVNMYVCSKKTEFGGGHYLMVLASGGSSLIFLSLRETE